MRYREFVTKATLDIMCASVASGTKTPLNAATSMVLAVQMAGSLENSELADWKKGLKDNSETKDYIQKYIEENKVEEEVEVAENVEMTEDGLKKTENVLFQKDD